MVLMAITPHIEELDNFYPIAIARVTLIDPPLFMRAANAIPCITSSRVRFPLSSKMMKARKLSSPT